MRIGIAVLLSLVIFYTIELEQNKALISSIEEELRFREQYVSELEKTLERRSSEFSELLEKVSDLESDLEKSQLENDELKERLNSFISLEATAYVPLCDTGCSGITRSGHDVRESKHIAGLRVVAVDPTIIPLGTTMTVYTENETFEAIALDTGGAIKGHKLDILVMSETRAWNFGRQKVFVEITGHVENYRSL